MQHDDFTIVDTIIPLHVASYSNKHQINRATSGIIVATYIPITPSIKPNIGSGELAYHNKILLEPTKSTTLPGPRITLNT